jgi:methionyl aminopeptidase
MKKVLEQIGSYGSKLRPRVAMQGVTGGKQIGAPFPIQPGTVSPMRAVPDHIQGPEYAKNGEPGEARSYSPRIYNAEEIEKARRAGRLARKMLDFANHLASDPSKGYSTEDVDRMTHEEIVKHGAYPSPINYRGFPKAVCSSVNEVVCHGIPDSRVIEAGDVVSIDVSLYIDGFHGDNCGTIICGGAREGHEEDDRAVALINATQEALDKSIEICGPGVRLSKIGEVIESVAANRDFRIIHEFCGHGTGELLHMPPFVRHFRNNDHQLMQPGMVFTIEPILVEGSRRMHVWKDGWSAATLDGGRGAQFEHEVLITEDGYEILTILE